MADAWSNLGSAYHHEEDLEDALGWCVQQRFFRRICSILKYILLLIREGCSLVLLRITPVRHSRGHPLYTEIFYCQCMHNTMSSLPRKCYLCASLALES